MIEILNRLPTPEEFIALRSETDWGVPPADNVAAALAASLTGVTAIDDGQLIGMARVVGDGVLNAYVQDVIVTKGRRGQGLGKALMTALVQNMSEHYSPDCLIGLFAADGQSEFYSGLGFKSRPDADYGPGMHAILSELAIRNISA